MDTRKRLWKSAVEIASLTRGLKDKAVLIDEGNIFQW